MYHTGRAMTFNAIGRFDKTREALSDLERLNQGRIPSDYTRQNAWTEIISATADFGMKEYGSATSKAISALLVCQDINSIGNIIIIQDLHQRLLTTAYKKDKVVKELGERLENMKR